MKTLLNGNRHVLNEMVISKVKLAYQFYLDPFWPWQRRCQGFVRPFTYLACHFGLILGKRFTEPKVQINFSPTLDQELVSIMSAP